MNEERNLNPKREENETYQDYKKRRAENNKWLKFHLEGEIVWESKKDGTYKKNIQRN
tara:strand:+ start:693 stop:863 length:171 start_codon:yes stop_codon:yes gene_type:complete